MSYYNYRDAYLDQERRRQAMIAQQQAQEAAIQAQNANYYSQANANRTFGDHVGTGITPNAGRPAQIEAARQSLAAQQALSGAYANEQAALSDRQYDIAENEQARKNRATEYERELGLAQIGSQDRMTEGMNSAFQGLNSNQKMPETDLFDNNGNRIGGSYKGGGTDWLKRSLTRR